AAWLASDRYRWWAWVLSSWMIQRAGQALSAITPMHPVERWKEEHAPVKFVKCARQARAASGRSGRRKCSARVGAVWIEAGVVGLERIAAISRLARDSELHEIPGNTRRRPDSAQTSPRDQRDRQPDQKHVYEHTGDPNVRRPAVADAVDRGERHD